MKLKVLQVTGYKNAGKTTLVCEIVRRLTAEGFVVGTAKRDDHAVDPEPAGADTRRHREAGARLAALSSAGRTLWVRERPADLEELLRTMEAEGADIVIVEGFKTAAYPKLVLLRGEEDADLLALDGVIGAAARVPLPGAELLAAAMGFPFFRVDDMAFAPLLDFVRGRLSV